MSASNYIVPVFPFIKVEVVRGVDLYSQVAEGIAVLKVDPKQVGRHMDICKVISVPATTNELSCSVGDYILVWSTAVEDFILPDNLGEVSLVRNPDIFATIDYEELIKSYDKE